MNVRNCRNCGRIFNYLSGSLLCQPCREAMEAKFQEVKEYVRVHPGVGIPEVSAACDVEPNQIRQWLKEERLEVTEDSAIYLNCEACGKPIRCGRFCEGCKVDMTRGFKNAMRKDPAPAPAPKKPNDNTNPRMRFL